jgi:hypothetical protein
MKRFPLTTMRFPLTTILGLLIILVCELFLWVDVHLSHRGPVHSEAQVNAILGSPAVGLLGDIAREVAVNMTALAWAGYILFMEGVLAATPGGSPVRKRPHHFALLFLASIFIWCVFDFVNFHAGMRGWIYIGMPIHLEDKFIPYFLAFGTIVPGMLMNGQMMLRLGWFNWARGPKWHMPGWGMVLASMVGLAMFAWPLIYPDPVTNVTLWASLVFLLDPINDRLGRPSMFRDWQNGWYGRMLAGFAGGLSCGLLWEFWNYWALTKWVYHLPFLGPWERVKYFEMPVPGLIGFVPFGLECWVMWQTMRIPLDGLAEPLPDERSLL